MSTNSRGKHFCESEARNLDLSHRDRRPLDSAAPFQYDVRRYRLALNMASLIKRGFIFPFGTCSVR